MTVSDMNPARWSTGFQWLLGAVGGLILAIGTIISGAVIQGYNFGVEREHARDEFVTVHSDIAAAGVAITKLVTSQESLQRALQQEHEDAGTAARAAASAAAAAAQAAATNAADLLQGRAQNLPRIDRLEAVIPPIQTDLAVIKQHLTDIENITRSHDADIKSTRDDARATRNAVAPRIDDHHGQ